MASLNAEIQDELKREFAKTCVDRGISQKDAVSDALVAWIGMPAQARAEEAVGLDTGIPHKFRPYLTKLAEVLAYGDSTVVRAITSNLDIYHDRVQYSGANKSTEP